MVETALVIGIILMMIINTIPVIQLLAVRYSVVATAHATAQWIVETGHALSPRPEEFRGWQAFAAATQSGPIVNPFINPDAMHIRAWCTPRFRSRECTRFDTIHMQIVYRDEPWIRSPFIAEIRVATEATMTYQHVPGSPRR